MNTATRKQETMPASEDAEKAILGAILLDNAIYYEATAGLSTADLFFDSHRKIYGAMCELGESSKAIDIVTLAEHLSNQGLVGQVGGVAYISSLTDGVPRRDNVEQYITIVKTKRQLRDIINASHVAIQRALEESEEPQVIVNDIQKIWMEAIALDSQNNSRTIAEATKELFNDLKEQRKVDSKRSAVGLFTGLKEFDELTSGYYLGETTVVAGVTSDGKTSLAIQALLENLREGTPCCMFSLEMPAKRIIARLFAGYTDVLPTHLRDGRLLEMFELNDLAEARKVTDKWPFWIEEAEGQSADKVASKMRLHARRDSCRLAVVDFLQLLGWSPSEGKVTKAEHVSRGIQTLRDTAKRENMHLLALSQLSVPEGKKKRTPTIFDLKESGDIANFANNVAFVYRPVNQEGQLTYKDWLILAKQRDGVTGTIPVRYNKNTLMYEYDKRSQDHRDE